MIQFRNKAEAQQAIQDMERRAQSYSRLADEFANDAHNKTAAEFSAEAARIRALLPTLPD